MDLLDKINNGQNILKELTESDLTKDIVNGKRLLHLLAARGDVSVIDKILTRFPKANPYMTDDEGNTLFHHLFKNGFYNKSIIDRYRRALWKINDRKIPVLRLAVDNHRLFSSLISNIKNDHGIITYSSSDKTSILTDIIDRSSDQKYIKLLKDIVSNRIDLNSKENLGIFYYCIDKNNSTAFNTILKRLKNVNIKAELGVPLISYAVLCNNESIVKMLCDRKELNVNVVGAESKFIPLNMSLIHKNENIIRSLMSRDPDMNIKDRFHNTIVHNFVSHWAISKNKQNIPIDIVLDVVSKGDINAKNFRNDTPLHIMAQRSTLKYLYNTIKDKDPDMSAVNIDNNTVFSFINPNDIDSVSYATAIQYKLIVNDSDNRDNSAHESTETNNSDHGLFNSDIVHSMIYTVEFMKRYPEISIPYQSTDKDKKIFDTWRLKMYKNNLIANQDTLWNLVDLYNGMLYNILPHVILWRSKEQHYIDEKMRLCIRHIIPSKQRFIMIKLTVIPNSFTTHANTVLYDKKLNKVIRFEPYGVNDIVDGDELDREIKKVFEDAVGKTVKYVRPEDYLLNFQWQTISHDSDTEKKILGDPVGYCLAWCYWFISIKMKNPDMDEKELMKHEFDKIKKQNTDIGNSYLVHIRSYSSKLDKMKNEFMKDIDIPNLAKYHTTYTDNNLNKILGGIKSELKTLINR